MVLDHCKVHAIAKLDGRPNASSGTLLTRADFAYLAPDLSVQLSLAVISKPVLRHLLVSFTLRGQAVTIQHLALRPGVMRQRLQSLIILGDHVLVAAKVLLWTRPIVVGRHLLRVLLVVVTVDRMRERGPGLVSRSHDNALRASAATISVKSTSRIHHLLLVEILLCLVHLINCGRSLHLVGVLSQSLLNG